MKLLALFALLAAAMRAHNNHHNDSLRAGEYPEVTFSPWKVHLS